MVPPVDSKDWGMLDALEPIPDPYGRDIFNDEKFQAIVPNSFANISPPTAVIAINHHVISGYTKVGPRNFLAEGPNYFLRDPAQL